MARRPRWSLGTLGVLAFACLLAASFAAATLATMTAAVRVLLVVTLVWGTLLCAALLLRALRSRRFAVYVIAGAAALLGIWATVGAREPSVSALRQAYLGTLQSFDGVPYVWGGETRSGIDCSGLARVALWQAMLRRGVSEVNPRLLGGALWGFWWRDMSAKDMLGGRYGYTRVIGRAPKLAGCDAESLHAGDLAVKPTEEIRGHLVESIARPGRGRKEVGRNAGRKRQTCEENGAGLTLRLPAAISIRELVRDSPPQTRSTRDERHSPYFRCAAHAARSRVRRRTRRLAEDAGHRRRRDRDRAHIRRHQLLRQLRRHQAGRIRPRRLVRS